MFPPEIIGLLPEHVGSPTIQKNIFQLDGTYDRVAVTGSFWNPTRATKSIRKIGLQFGTIVKAGGSGIRLSLQNLSAAGIPDGTQDQYVDVPNASIASDTWLMSGNLSADRSIAFGETVGIMMEWDGAGRLSSDVVAWLCSSPSLATIFEHSLTIGRRTIAGSSWTSNVFIRLPSVLFECSDGTLATLQGARQLSDATTLLWNSGTASPKEVAQQFTPDVDVQIDGICAGMFAAGTSSDFDFCLYEGTTLLDSVSIDSSWDIQAGNYAYRKGLFDSSYTLEAGTDYYLSIKPTTANNIGVRYYTLNDSAGYLDFWPMGDQFAYAERTTGAWTAYTNRRVSIGPVITPHSSGGGVIVVED